MKKFIPKNKTDKYIEGESHSSQILGVEKSFLNAPIHPDILDFLEAKRLSINYTEEQLKEYEKQWLDCHYIDKVEIIPFSKFIIEVKIVETKINEFIDRFNVSSYPKDHNLELHLNKNSYYAILPLIKYEKFRNFKVILEEKMADETMFISIEDFKN